MQADYFTISELADRWKLSQSTVRRKIKAGELATVRIGRAVRIDRSEIERVEASWKAQP